MTRLVAPQELCGKMHRYHPMLGKRLDWMNARIEEGYHGTEIAEALGIHATQVNRIVRVDRPKNWNGAYIRRKWKVHAGSIHRALTRMVPEDREALLDAAQADGGDIADYLVTHWLRTS